MEKYYNLKIMNPDILWYKVYDTKTIVAKSFGYILCTTMKTYLWTDHLDRHHVFCQQSPFASNNEALQ